METKLLPCPFCGGEASFRGMGGLYWVGCDSCKGNNSDTTQCCAGCAWVFDTPEKAAKAWNTRHERTCHVAKQPDGYGWACECGGFFPPSTPPRNFCPKCGARLKDETDAD